MCGNISPVPVSRHQYVYSFCNFNPVFMIAALVKTKDKEAELYVWVYKILKILKYRQ